MFVCLLVCLLVCFFVCLFVCLFVFFKRARLIFFLTSRVKISLSGNLNENTNLVSVYVKRDNIKRLVNLQNCKSTVDFTISHVSSRLIPRFSHPSFHSVKIWEFGNEATWTIPSCYLFTVYNMNTMTHTKHCTAPAV